MAGRPGSSLGWTRYSGRACVFTSSSLVSDDGCLSRWRTPPYCEVGDQKGHPKAGQTPSSREGDFVTPAGSEMTHPKEKPQIEG